MESDSGLPGFERCSRRCGIPNGAAGQADEPACPNPSRFGRRTENDLIGERSAYHRGMRTILIAVGILVALFGLLFTLQGVGVVSGSPMSNTPTWSVLGPIIVVTGIVIAYGGWRRRR